MDEEGRRFVDQLQIESGTHVNPDVQPAEIPLYDDAAHDSMDWVHDDDGEPSDELEQVHHNLRDLRLSM